MYILNVNSNPLNVDEKNIFFPHLNLLGIDENIWDVYDQFLETSTKYSLPKILRIKNNEELLAIAFLIKCKNYGETLSRVSFVQWLIRQLGIPVYVWMKSGIAAENFANPGFLNYENTAFDDKKLISFLKKRFLLLFIHDKKKNTNLYPDSIVFNYPDDGIIRTTKYSEITDYLKEHKNLKKKIKHYKKHNGRIEIAHGKLEQTIQTKIRESVVSTANKSLFKLPYQENYANMCVSSARIPNDNIVHFICWSDGTFLGYHSFVKLKDQMRCMNGAFNRNLPTTHHAYENMIFRSVDYAIEHGVKEIHYGPVLNETKKRMMNEFVSTQLYLYSSIKGFNKLLSPFLKRSGLQNKSLQEFSDLAS